MNETDPIYRADCPSRIILDQIADKWSMMVLEVLREPRRFNAIKRRLDGVTQRVLTQTLRKLERNGMVKRRVQGVGWASARRRIFTDPTRRVIAGAVLYFV